MTEINDLGPPRGQGSHIPASGSSVGISVGTPEMEVSGVFSLQSWGQRAPWNLALPREEGGTAAL